MRKARAFLQSQGTMIWYQSLTCLSRFIVVAVLIHLLRISRFILLHKISGRNTNCMWHHIAKTLSRTAAEKEAWTGGRRRWKESPGCHSESIVDFSGLNVPFCRRKSTMSSCTCLVMRVSNQANNYQQPHTHRERHTQLKMWKKKLSRQFYYWKLLCLVYLFLLYSPGP